MRVFSIDFCCSRHVGKLLDAFVDSAFAAGATEHAASDEYKRPDLPCQELDLSSNRIAVPGGPSRFPRGKHFFSGSIERAALGTATVVMARMLILAQCSAIL